MMRTMTRDEITSRLGPLGLDLPPTPEPVANYLPAKLAGGLIYCSGQLPAKGGKLVTGSVPSRVTIEEAADAARQCVLNALAAALSVGEPAGVLRVGVFVQCDGGFADQPKVANGASDLLVAIFGESGRHARAAVGASGLPLDACVEVELVLTT